MKIDVLDHGYVRFVEAWGHGDAGEGNPGLESAVDFVADDYECGIIEAARQSTQGSFRGWEPERCNCQSPHDFRPDLGCSPGCASVKNPGDEKLLRYLYQHNHATPFEFAGMVIEVQAPIFVFREWHRHRTQSYNEMSGRYEELPDLYYSISFDQLKERIEASKLAKSRQAQGKGQYFGTDDELSRWLLNDAWLQQAFQAHYTDGLAMGIPREIARKKMPVDHYSKMRASGNLRNWLAFLTLRTDLAAQWEIRQFAVAVGKIIHEKFPRTFFEWAKEVTK